ncbi:Os12g0635750 [Oryza sativa Japonica Group]|uniref:Os12g0635750 protein n=1 Tax=Oryza sativa subsp. japonica TaxID=39947 RepID=A0A0P0YCS1_ORYSJ|nr:Os12g0635750 [Oryza sativa Japonica Group]
MEENRVLDLLLPMLRQRLRDRDRLEEWITGLARDCHPHALVDAARVWSPCPERDHPRVAGVNRVDEVGFHRFLGACSAAPLDEVDLNTSALGEALLYHLLAMPAVLELEEEGLRIVE